MDPGCSHSREDVHAECDAIQYGLEKRTEAIIRKMKEREEMRRNEKRRADRRGEPKEISK